MTHSLLKVLVVGMSVSVIGCTSYRQAPVVDLVPSTPVVVTKSPELSNVLEGSSDIEVKAIPDESTQAIALSPNQQPKRPEALDSANPAVVALINSAASHSKVGQYDAASASLERALQIEPDNAWVWHRLAKTRLAQGQLDEAVNLAIRSNTLAADDRALLADNWRVIAVAREQSGDVSGAKAAILRVEDYVSILN